MYFYEQDVILNCFQLKDKHVSITFTREAVKFEKIGA